MIAVFLSVSAYALARQLVRYRCVASMVLQRARGNRLLSRHTRSYFAGLLKHPISFCLPSRLRAEEGANSDTKRPWCRNSEGKLLFTTRRADAAYNL
eukprot:1192889-Prorocentrum_minimum.AAC.2